MRSVKEKRGIIAESFEPGATVAGVARKHGINANQLFKWRHREAAGLLGRRRPKAKDFEEPTRPVEFVSLGVVDDRGVLSSPVLPELPSDARVAAVGKMEIALPNGGRIHVDSSVNGASLRRVLLAMKGAV